MKTLIFNGKFINVNEDLIIDDHKGGGKIIIDHDTSFHIDEESLRVLKNSNNIYFKLYKKYINKYRRPEKPL